MAERDAESQAHLKQVPTADQAVQDALDLAELGHAETLTRKFGTWSMFFLAFSVLGTWSTFAQGLNSGLTAGGPVAILWGLVLVFFCNICVAISLAELCSAMPTALGQAYWVSRLWPGGGGRFASYMCAWINKFGWWTLSASQVAFMSDFMLSMRLLFDPEWDGAHGWVKFLLYLAATAVVTLFNIVACRRDAILPFFNNFVGVTFVTLFFVFSLALLISVGTKNGQTFQPPSFVFGRWINETGWNDGVTWFLGLVQAAYGLTAFDAAIHLVEEIPSPRTNVPRVMWLSVTLGAISGFIFMVVCLFCIQDLDAVIDPVTGLPFVELLHQTLGLDGATVLLSFFIFNGMGQAASIVTTSSRLTWGFARDGGIPWGPYFSKIDTTWQAPVRALWLQGGIIGLVGVLYTFADTVLEAILGVAVIALTISYGMPILVLLFVGRDKMPPAIFRLGRFGAVINWISVIYCAITSVFFFFPGTPNPTGSDMNYAIAVFGVMMIVSLGFWVIKGRNTYLRADEIEEVVIEARRAELSRANADSKDALEETMDTKDRRHS
ncbi:choline transport protein [Plectosphaerella cucumerina]|uniref:Choline transport protein n=1 Tax=Plectosphaerella cucumerina TaxID=40658 RepID=A0A8K0X2P8_9PEZI|nr:choline transport protein [Plectosphaerella cucumerina]